MALPGLFVEYPFIAALALLCALPPSGPKPYGEGLDAPGIAMLASATHVSGALVAFVRFIRPACRDGSQAGPVRRIREPKGDGVRFASEHPFTTGHYARPTGGEEPQPRTYQRALSDGFAQTDRWPRRLLAMRRRDPIALPAVAAIPTCFYFAGSSHGHGVRARDKQSCRDGEQANAGLPGSVHRDERAK